MALTFDVSKIEDYNEKYGQAPFDVQWHPVTEVIVHRMMHTGLGWELTESNAAEFYARCIICDKLSGSLLYGEATSEDEIRETRSLTVQEIKDHIGLKCNVAPEPRYDFVLRYIKFDFIRLTREYSDAATDK